LLIITAAFAAEIPENVEKLPTAIWTLKSELAAKLFTLVPVKPVPKAASVEAPRSLKLATPVCGSCPYAAIYLTGVAAPPVVEGADVKVPVKRAPPPILRIETTAPPDSPPPIFDHVLVATASCAMLVNVLVPDEKTKEPPTRSDEVVLSYAIAFTPDVMVAICVHSVDDATFAHFHTPTPPPAKTEVVVPLVTVTRALIWPLIAVPAAPQVPALLLNLAT
jgi:hypothetical protein